MIKITREQEIWKRKIIADRIYIMNEEQSLKNKIQALSGIDNIYLDTICNTCKRRATEEHRYLQLLNQVVTRLLDGVLVIFHIVYKVINIQVIKERKIWEKKI